jgi:hypothetical protein
MRHFNEFNISLQLEPYVAGDYGAPFVPQKKKKNKINATAI